MIFATDYNPADEQCFVWNWPAAVHLLDRALDHVSGFLSDHTDTCQHNVGKPFDDWTCCDECCALQSAFECLLVAMLQMGWDPIEDRFTTAKSQSGLRIAHGRHWARIKKDIAEGRAA